MTKKPDKMEKFHMDRIAEKGCLICKRPAVIHHSLCFRPRNHKYILPLCPDHHNMTNDSVHMNGNERKFFKQWGINPERWALDAWTTSVAIFQNKSMWGEL